MAETFAQIPQERLADCASYNFEHRILKDQYFLRMDAPSGVPHDPKAQILSDGGRDLCGHAGLFSTLNDMVKLCQALLSKKLLSMEALLEIGVNRTGHMGADGSYRQYLGYLCFVKSPAQRFSEVPQWMGSRAFGLSGFTGNHIAIDPEKGVFDLFLGNRCHNRVSVIQPLEGRDIASYGLTPEGEGAVEWTDGRKVRSSYLYIHQKDQKLHGPILEHMRELGWLHS
jgi:CubicO group peptidase (beta-lactamase class C family)